MDAENNAHVPRTRHPLVLVSVDLDKFDAHTALRSVLSVCLGEPEAQITWQKSDTGKPVHPRIFFNLSHSGERALIAVSALGPVGVDIERQRPLPNLIRIAERFFAPCEHDYLESLSAESREVAFFEIWTAKEALIKAKGLRLLEHIRTEIVWPMVHDGHYQVHRVKSPNYIAHLAFQGHLTALEALDALDFSDHFILPSLTLGPGSIFGRGAFGFATKN